MMAQKCVPVHVVEDHDQALPLIYRAIGAKKLPFDGIALVHFDAHPDLLSPNILADDCLDKEKLFALTSIAEWVLPAVYMGHIGCVVWLKPPWADQMPDGQYQLCVGKDRATEHIRVATPLPYFISELLYVPRNELENTSTIPLHVITVRPSDPCHKVNQPHLSVLSSANDTHTCTPDPCTRQELHTSEEVNMHVRDTETLLPIIDKDCRSAAAQSSSVSDTKHELSAPPRKKQKTDCCPQSKDRTPTLPAEGATTRTLTSEGACSVSGILDFCFPADVTRQLDAVIGNSTAWILDIDLDFFSTGNPFKSLFTEAQYEYLQSVYSLTVPTDPTSSEAIAVCVQKRWMQMDSLKTLWCNKTDDDSSSELLKGIRSLIGTVQEGAEVAAEDIHLAGMMSDLPEHISTEKEIEDLAAALHSLLRYSSKDPTLITIARSTEDNYTPKFQVDFIQQLVISEVENLYHDTHVVCHYLNTPYEQHVSIYAPST